MRLFLFGVGGTGGRLVEALSFLLAAGVRLVDSNDQPIELIPILIDTDADNKDTLDGVSALKLYTELHSMREETDRSGFFATKIGPLSSLTHEKTTNDNVRFRLAHRGVENQTFGEFIDFDLIEHFETKRFLETIYSDENFTDELTGGFLGNPNVGAVVLAGSKRSADFNLFASAFTEGDRVFIAGSIFGGTGAAGVPWLLKELRKEKTGTGASNAIRNAAIGSLLVLPYFKVEQDNKSRIDSSVFITKTKAALSYYSKHMRGSNAVYYISDEARKTYPNHESGSEQSNAAHLVELLGALAVIEFAKQPDNICRPPKESFYEYAIGANSETLDFSTLGNPSSRLITKQLTQLHMLALLVEGYFPDSYSEKWAKQHGYDSDFFKSTSYKTKLSTFLSAHYLLWIRQMARNSRGFAPFREIPNLDDMSRMRTDQVAKKPFFLKPPLGRERFTMAANTQSVGLGERASMAQFLKLWWDVTSTVFDASYEKV